MTQDNHNNEASVSVNEPEKNNDGAIESVLLSCDHEEILKECAALIVYISRHGNILTDKATDAGGTTQKEIDEVKQDYKMLIEGVMTCNSANATSDDWQKLMMAYTGVTRFTFAREGVNGRSVLDTLGGKMRIFQTESKKPRRWWQLRLPRWLSCSLKPQHKPMCYVILFLVAALALELLMGWAGREKAPDDLEGYLKYQYYIVIDLAHLLVPAFWGAIGACVYLMKRISDRLGKLAYEQSRQQGNGARILLGAILAVVMVEIIFSTESQSLTADDANLGPMALAFAVGLSIKPIYAAFEIMVEGVAKRFQTKK